MGFDGPPDEEMGGFTPRTSVRAVNAMAAADAAANEAAPGSRRSMREIRDELSRRSASSMRSSTSPGSQAGQGPLSPAAAPAGSDPVAGDTVLAHGRRCTVQYVTSKGLYDLKPVGGGDPLYGVALADIEAEANTPQTPQLSDMTPEDAIEEIERLTEAGEEVPERLWAVAERAVTEQDTPAVRGEQDTPVVGGECVAGDVDPNTDSKVTPWRQQRQYLTAAASAAETPPTDPAPARPQSPRKSPRGRQSPRLHSRAAVARRSDDDQEERDMDLAMAASLAVSSAGRPLRRPWKRSTRRRTRRRRSRSSVAQNMVCS